MGCFVMFAVAITGILLYSFWTRGVSLRSDTLPPLVPDFTGRRNETKEILDMLSFKDERNVFTIINIAGAPGFGKSTLAVCIGHYLLSSWIYVHYVDLTHSVDINLIPNTIKTAALGTSKSLENELIFGWARRISVETVIILDNCDDLTQNDRGKFFSLVKRLASSSPKLKLLITTRFQFPEIDARFGQIKIGPLSSVSSVTLLHSMMPTMDHLKLKTLADLTGNAALALKVVGALIREGDDPDELIEELEFRPLSTLSPQDFNPEDQLQKCIESSFHRLPQGLKEALTAFGIFPGSFDKLAAADILKITTAGEAPVSYNFLRPLTRRCLVEYDHQSQRYRLHRLIKAFVKESQDSKTYQRPHLYEQRYFWHYYQSLKDLGIRYQTASLEVLRLFDQDQHNFCVVLNMLLSQIPGVVQSSVQSESHIALANLTVALLHARLMPDRLTTWYIKLLHGHVREISDVNSVSPFLCQAVYLLAHSLVRQGNDSRAMEMVCIYGFLLPFCDKMYKHRMGVLRMVCLKDTTPDIHLTNSTLKCHTNEASHLHLPISENSTLWELATLYANAGYTDSACLCYRTAADVLKSTGATGRDAAMKYKEASQYLIDHGMGEEATEAVVQAYTIYVEELAKHPQDHGVYFMVGRLLYKMDIPEKALEPLMVSLEMRLGLFGELHTDSYSSLVNLGHVYSRLSDFDLAAEYYNRSLIVARHIKGNTTDLIELLGCYAKSLMRLENDESITYLKERAELLLVQSKGIVSRDYLSALIQMAVWYNGRARLMTAYKYYSEAYRIAWVLRDTNSFEDKFGKTTQITGRHTGLGENKEDVSTLTAILKAVLPHRFRQNIKEAVLGNRELIQVACAFVLGNVLLILHHPLIALLIFLYLIRRFLLRLISWEIFWESFLEIAINVFT